ncbi:MAG: hypothetical protein A2W93_07205 [Bacteroidetes bacterium GWF2_43_63]|nr:MAG: hypothetical protein A2W94_15275 [Bacteroidetes bacterium GWE2_42_42]OFY54016.1 MAG: hypothetical protein A2W93_07205 [Bacteroidetes bacterium GWF2_43_63]HCB63576.1 hypothetical protein [Bacteroidales bacterium]HCY23178.1 hypothetical protein [Bacteroidales bacterium]
MKSTILFIWTFLLCVLVGAQETKTHSVYFNTAVFQPDAKAIKTLDSVAKYCKAENAVIKSISGYCDSVGTSENNQLLSEKRANAVKSVFAQKGIELKNTQIVGKNETLEFNDNAFFRNRRVDVVTFKPAEKKVSALEDKITQATVGEVIRLDNITFYNNTSTLRPESEPVINELYSIMESQPTLEIAIEGHICCISDDFSNLSGERAQVVYNYLIRKGIAANRMSYQGFGHTRPLNEERTEAERQMNRRVEIRVVKK